MAVLKKQNFEIKDEKIKAAFQELKKSSPGRFKRRLNLSWSNWGFGLEPFSISVERLNKAGIEYVELHGNHYGHDLGYRADKTLKILRDYGMKTAGICGMFSADNDLSSNRAVHRQNAVDYLKREIEFTAEMGGSYILVVPGAVGRPQAYDRTEFERSVETLLLVADIFLDHGIKAAIEPIRAAEVSFIHTIADAKEYIKAVNHPGVRHINGDVYHMQDGESHIGEAIIEAGEQLVNLHISDSNRRSLGDGSLNLDAIIMALYIIGFNAEGMFVTPEPLGPGGDPYYAVNSRQDKTMLDRLVMQTIGYFREREELLIS